MMQHDLIIFSIFLVFTGAAVLGGIALYARQSLLIAYIVIGVILGQWGLGLVENPEMIQEIGHIGIIFLLFLLGLNLHPQKLIELMGQAIVVTIFGSLVFSVVGFLIGYIFQYTLWECLLIGAVMMFSSTIISLKLLPSTELHHKHKGEVIISIVLLQDIIAIILLLLLEGYSHKSMSWQDFWLTGLSLPGLVVFSFLAQRYIVHNLIKRFDAILEYVFLLAIGWCLAIAQLAHALGLSYEIGAFIAGVSLASSPISRFIAERLKPLRDFFLIMFFFSLGASFDMSVLPTVIIPAVIIAFIMILLKPVVFGYLFVKSGEDGGFSREVGIRLGQLSEFSLLIAVLAVEANVIGKNVSFLIQAATLITFILSSYIVMLLYPTPISVNDRLRRD